MRRTSRGVRAVVSSLLVIFSVVGTAACRGNVEPAHPDVMATTAVVGALTRAVAGDALVVGTLVGPGLDPHEYEASPDDATKIGRAKLVLRNGIGIDASLDKVIASSGQQTVVTVTEGIKLRRHMNEGGKPEDDPHVWHDPTNAKVMVENIVRALSTAFPSKADVLAKNAKAYQAKLDIADAEIKALIDGIPEANRKMVTNHDAFGYFIDRYGLIYIGAVIPSLTTAGEPSAKEVSDLQNTIKREGVKAIFAESSVDPKVAREIAKDTKVRIVDDLYGDSLGKEGSEADTVDKMLVANAKKIANALKTP